MEGNCDQSGFWPYLSELAWSPKGQGSFLTAHSPQTLKSSASCNRCQGAGESRLGTSRRSSGLSGLLVDWQASSSCGLYRAPLDNGCSTSAAF